MMKTWKCFTGLMFAMLCSAVVMAQRPIEGNWTTLDDKTREKRAIIHLTVAKDGILSGTIVKTFPQPGDTGICSKCPGTFKDQPIVGLQFVWGLKEKNPNAWSDGKILDAKSGKIYRVKMAVKGNKLYVRGYVGLSMMGRTQVWLRG